MNTLATNDLAINNLIMSALRDPKVQQSLPTFRNISLLEAINSHLNSITGQSFLKVIDVDDKSSGLIQEDRKIRLAEDWGVKVSNFTHPSYIDTPTSIRIFNNQIYVANSNPTGSVLVSVFDLNLNYLFPLGIKGSNLLQGNLQTVTDVCFDGGTGKYYLAGYSDNIVQIFSKINGSYVASLGTGTAGADGATLTNPVAVGVGVANIYVLCQNGTPAGATGGGFLATYKDDGTFKTIPLYKGLNGGSGRCSQGEIVNPKDLFVVSTGGRDLVYILNGTDEIGVFNSDDFKLVDIYNIPSEITESALGLTRICIRDNILYVTAATIGKIIAIDLKTKKLIGSFGMLRSEATTDNDGTIGYFNGLGGIAVIEDRIIVTESLNNRIQTVGKSILSDTNLYITFKPVNIQTKHLIDIAPSLAGESNTDIVLVDPSNNAEYDIKTAIARNLSFFAVKMKINPHMFSKKKRIFEIYPVYILVEN